MSFQVTKNNAPLADMTRNDLGQAMLVKHPWIFCSRQIISLKLQSITLKFSTVLSFEREVSFFLQMITSKLCTYLKSFILVIQVWILLKFSDSDIVLTTDAAGAKWKLSITAQLNARTPPPPVSSSLSNSPLREKIVHHKGTTWTF